MAPRISRLPPLPTIRDVLRVYQLRAVKHLSQNFLLDMNLNRKFVRALTPSRKLKDAFVYEIGPGPGGITRALLETDISSLVVIEKDRRFLPSLQFLSTFADNRMHIIHADILRYTWEQRVQQPNWMDAGVKPNEDTSEPSCIDPEFTDPKITKRGRRQLLFDDLRLQAAATPLSSSSSSSSLTSSSSPEVPVYLCGNLPFNVATPLIIFLLETITENIGPFAPSKLPLMDGNNINNINNNGDDDSKVMTIRPGPVKAMTFTLQKEVAERVIAPIMDLKQRCRLSVMCQYACDVELVFHIPSQTFVPEPKVDAAVVRFTPLETPRIACSYQVVRKIVRHIFFYRRKYCVKGIEHLFPEELFPSDAADAIFRRARVNPQALPTCLSIEEIGDLCEAYEEMCRNVPGLFHYDYTAPVPLNMLELLEDPFPPQCPWRNVHRRASSFKTNAGVSLSALT